MSRLKVLNPTWWCDWQHFTNLTFVWCFLRLLSCLSFKYSLSVSFFAFSSRFLSSSLLSMLSSLHHELLGACEFFLIRLTSPDWAFIEFCNGFPTNARGFRMFCFFWYHSAGELTLVKSGGSLMWSKIFFPRSLTHEEGYRAEAITPEVTGQVASCNCQELGQNSKTASAMELPCISTDVTHHDPSQFDFESTCYSRAGSVSQFLHSRESLNSSPGRQSDAESKYLHHISWVERAFNNSERRDSKITGPARNEMESPRSTQPRRSPSTTAWHSRNHLVTRSAS